MQVGLHDHREQGLVDPAAPLQQAGKERPGPQLGDPQLQIPRRGGQHPRAMAVALGQPLGRPLMWGGTDHRRQLSFDQGLVDRLGGLADAVIHLRGHKCIQDLQQCRLVKSHRALCPFARTIGLVSLTIARWPLCCMQLRHHGPATYTTPWDATDQGCCGVEVRGFEPLASSVRGGAAHRGADQRLCRSLRTVRDEVRRPDPAPLGPGSWDSPQTVQLATHIVVPRFWVRRAGGCAHAALRRPTDSPQRVDRSLAR
jgi:hypothetical protein